MQMQRVPKNKQITAKDIQRDEEKKNKRDESKCAPFLDINPLHHEEASQGRLQWVHQRLKLSLLSWEHGGYQRYTNSLHVACFDAGKEAAPGDISKSTSHTCSHVKLHAEANKQELEAHVWRHAALTTTKQQHKPHTDVFHIISGISFNAHHSCVHIDVHLQHVCADMQKRTHVLTEHTSLLDPLLAVKIVHFLLELTWKEKFL